MLWLGISILLTGLWGIFITLYWTMQRFKSPWRWPVGILCGILVGLLMAFIDFMILWPPVKTIGSLIGIALLLLISVITIFDCKLPKLPKFPSRNKILKRKNKKNNIIYLNRYQRLRRIIQKNNRHKQLHLYKSLKLNIYNS